jgi:hypothetical protein
MLSMKRERESARASGGFCSSKGQNGVLQFLPFNWFFLPLRASCRTCLTS